MVNVSYIFSLRLALDWSNCLIIFKHTFFSFQFLGFYVAPTQKESTLNSSVEKLTEHIVSELNNGAFDCPEVKCGFIGEIGCCDPLDGKNIKLLL